VLVSLASYQPSALSRQLVRATFASSIQTGKTGSDTSFSAFLFTLFQQNELMADS